MNNLKTVKTVIIGSGVSGISCGINLLENNYDDWLIFEALDRIGGRCSTIEIGDTYLELGAQFIHGQQDNPIYNIAQKNKQVHDIFNEIILDEKNLNIEKVLYMTQEGKEVDAKLADEILNQTEDLFKKAKEYSFEIQRDETNKENNRSVAEYVYDKFCENLRANNDMSNDMIRMSEGFLIWRCRLENLLASTSTLLDLSIKNFCAYQELNGSQAVETKYGYKSILNKIIDSQREKFEKRLCLKHMFKKVLICDSKSKNCAHCQYTSEPNLAVVLLNDPSNKELIVLCENIVLTISLGCLKANLNTIIEPNSLVSDKKRTSIERVGYGTVNKIFLFYDKKFWPNDVNILRPIWLTNGESFLEKMKKPSELDWAQSICEIDIKETKENESYCLLFWLHGCEFYDKFTDEKIINDLTCLLSAILNKNDIPEPTKILKTAWHSDPLFRGSYSYFPVGSHYLDTVNLIEPICINNKPVVMFAGEATHLKHFSTVHGGYLTGIREANRILNLRDKN